MTSNRADERRAAIALVRGEMKRLRGLMNRVDGYLSRLEEEKDQAMVDHLAKSMGGYRDPIVRAAWTMAEYTHDAAAAHRRKG